MRRSKDGSYVYNERIVDIGLHKLYFWRPFPCPWTYLEGKCQVVSHSRPLSNCTSFLINAYSTTLLRQPL